MKIVIWPVCLLSMALGVARADTLYSLANDIQNDVLVVEKTGTCKANPYLLNSSHNHSVAPCAAVTAQCPAGTTMIPPISTCALTPSTSDGAILAALKQAYGNYITDLTKPKPFDSQRLGSPNTSLKCNTTTNNSNYYYSYFYVENNYNLSQSGYSPFCFYDLSKVGGSGFAQPKYVSASGFVEMSNGATISLSDLNTAANYQCYTSSYKATARCITIPSGLLNKLGIKLK